MEILDLFNGGDQDFDDLEISFELEDTGAAPEPEPGIVPEPQPEPDPEIPVPTAGPVGEDSGNEIRIEAFVPTLSSEDLTSSIEGEISSEDFEFTILRTFSGFVDEEDSAGTVEGTIDISGVSENRGSIIYDYSDTINPATLPNVDFFGEVFTDFSDTIPAFENVTIETSTSNIGIDSSAINFSENTIEVNFAGVSLDSNSILELDIEFADI